MNLRPLSRLCGGVAVAAGVVVLAGWAFRLPVLISLIPGAASAQPLTALAMSCSGAALVLHGVRRPRARAATVTLSALVAALCLLTLGEYFGLGLRLDQLLFPGALAEMARGYPHPGRMSEVTALCFLLVACATAAKTLDRAVRAAVVAATAALVLAGIALLAFAFDAPVYQVAGFGAVSLPTAAVLATLAIGVLAAEPLKGWPRCLTMDTPGGNVSRVLLPVAVLLPIGLGVIALMLTRSGYVEPDFRLAAVCAVTASVFGTVVMWSAGRLDMLDTARQKVRTAQLLAEDRLRQSQRLATLLQLSRDAIIVWSVEHGVESWSDGAAALYGYTRDEALGRSLPELLQSRPDPTVKLSKARQHGSWEGELQHTCKDGRQVVVSARLQLVVGDDGEERVFEVNRDITERKRVTRELEESRASLATLVDTVDQMVWSARPDGFHDFFNRFWYDFTGAEPGTTDGEDWSQWLHPDDRARTAARWRHSLETGEPYEIEYRFRTRTGEYRWYLARARPVRDASGRIIRWMGTGTDIHEQKQFGERFRLLHQAHPTAYLVLSPDFVVEEASELWLEATMNRREQMIGRNLFEAMPDNPDDPAASGVRNLRASLERVLANRAPDRMPLQRYDVRRPDGTFEIRWWAPLNTPVMGDDANVHHIIHQVDDVTGEVLERERAAEARAGEARYRAVAESMPGLVFETDADGTFTYVNTQLLEFTGKTLPELREGWLQVVEPEDRDRVAAAWAEAVRTTRLYQVECRLRRADGAVHWFMIRASPIRDSEGRVEKWIGVGADVDDAKRAEAVLRESEEQFRGMAEALPQLAWMADAKGWIYWYNQRWYDYTGTTLEEMKGWGWRKVHHPDHVDQVVERIQHAWDTGEPWEDTFPLRGADGRYRWFLSRAEPLKDSEGRVTRWFGTNTDVTEQTEAAELQRTLMQEVSHRVKNSLALVSSLLNLQARTIEGDARLQLQEASSRVHAVARVHDQLWRGVGTREIDLTPFLCDLCDAIGATAPRHATVCHADPAIVSADMAVPIGLLVNELLTNAYKYAYPEGGEGEVRLTGALEPDGRYRLEVADRGRGLPAGFDLASARSSLGMRVITSLSAQLRGELSAGSAEPGARFTVVFPLKAE